MPSEQLTPPFPQAWALAWTDELALLDAQWQGGDSVPGSEIHQTLHEWRQRLQRPERSQEEWFDIVDASGQPLGTTAPRWFCQLTGLRCRVVHLFLTTAQDLLVLQIRAHDKPEWPSHLDTTVGGHLKAGQDWTGGVMAETAEEIGLQASEVERWLEGGKLLPVDDAYEYYGVDETFPAMRSRQMKQIYAGQLTDWGLAHLHFADREVGALYLCKPEEAKRLLSAGSMIAPGLQNTFPKWWAWRSRHQA